MTNKNKVYKKTLFIFRRDYRIHDNTTLIKACKCSDNVIPIFIFTYKQIRDNTLKSDNCVKFLVESLEELNDELNNSLRIYYGDEFKILNKLISKNEDIECIAFNNDYTAYSMERDEKICKLAKKYNKDTIICDDILLFPLKSILTTSKKKVYSRYTPYYNKAIKEKVRDVDNYTPKNIDTKKKYKIKGYKEYTAPLKSFYDDNNIATNNLIEKPGRKAGLKILKEIKNDKWNDYNKCRNFLTYDTTHLSPYNKFGCISIREVYFAIKNSSSGKKNELISQIIWRDFFYNLSHENPEMYKKSRNGILDRNIKWSRSIKKFNAWKNGKTGFPIVDACMNELNKTGYLHNRGRLIVSNFLTRLLHINWHKGEYYFAKKLYDYDPTHNSFGWQISASISGTESRPISQMIYNPWLQSDKSDPDAKYIKKWIPELNNIPASKIHEWFKYYDECKNDTKYIKPIIDYDEEREHNLKLIK